MAAKKVKKSWNVHKVSNIAFDRNLEGAAYKAIANALRHTGSVKVYKAGAAGGSMQIKSTKDLKKWFATVKKSTVKLPASGSKKR